MTPAPIPMQLHKILFPGLLALSIHTQASAQTMVLGSADTFIHAGSPASGAVDLVGLCGGQVASATAAEDRVFIGDQTGTIYQYDATLGLSYAFDSIGLAAALAVHDTVLFVTGSAGSIYAYDRFSFDFLATEWAPVSADALLVVGDDLYVGSEAGLVFRRDLTTQDPFTFWGTCGGAVAAMATDGTHLLLGTTAGAVYRLDLATQQVTQTYILGTDVSAMAMHQGDLLVGSSDGQLRRVNPATGFVHDVHTFQSTLEGIAMLGESTPGEAYCFGNACPCGNDDGNAGCANSLGSGALLRAEGSASVTTGDFELFATGVPANQYGIFYQGLGDGVLPLGDGLFCTASGGTGYGNYRFPVTQAGPGGFISATGLVDYAAQNFDAQGQVTAGSTWYFQLWYRDPSGPCNQNFNTSNAYRLTFQP